MNALRTIPSLVGAAALALAAGGCDWRTFDDLADQAWANSSSSPSAINASNYGTGVAFSGTSANGVKFLATTERPDGVAMIQYDSAGKLTGGGETIEGGGGATSPDPLAVRPPLAGDVMSTEGAIGIGLGEAGGTAGRVLIYRPDGPSLFRSIPVGTAAVDAVGFGPVNNPDNSGMVDLIATTGQEITVVSAYEADANTRTVETCTVAQDRAYAVAVADVDSGSAESEIVVSMGNANQDGAPSAVTILDGATVSAAAADQTDQSCVANGRTSLGELTAPGSEPDFGAALVVADFDGGNGLDIAVGAPSSNKVYVYMNVDFNGGTPGAPIEINGPSGSGKFGETLAAGDFDGDGADELVVGDTQITVSGAKNAGRAYIIPSDGNFGTQYTLGDADPEGDQNFGRGLAVGTFDGTGTVLAVAARKEVFTYFRTQLSDDVRK